MSVEHDHVFGTPINVCEHKHVFVLAVRTREGGAPRIPTSLHSQACARVRKHLLVFESMCSYSTDIIRITYSKYNFYYYNVYIRITVIIKTMYVYMYLYIYIYLYIAIMENMYIYIYITMSVEHHHVFGTPINVCEHKHIFV